jgi:hypothetical protein
VLKYLDMLTAFRAGVLVGRHEYDCTFRLVRMGSREGGRVDFPSHPGGGSAS